MSEIIKSQLVSSRLETAKRCTVNLQIKHPLKIRDLYLDKSSKVIVDGEIRDRAIWAADLYAAGPYFGKNIKGGNKIWRNSLLAISSGQYRNGKLPACVSLQLKYRLLSPYFDTYGMWWIISANEYLQKTGDAKFRYHFLKVLANCINYYSEKVDESGLYKASIINFYSNWTIMRPRINVLANALYYQVMKIAEEYKLTNNFEPLKFKNAFISTFWNPKHGLLTELGDKNISFLDANSAAILFGLTDRKKTSKVINSLAQFKSKYGFKSYIGKVMSIASYHKNLISPFMNFLLCKALENSGKINESKYVQDQVLRTGVSISKKYGRGTLPEYWTTYGELGTKPALGYFSKYGRSSCHVWGLFGDIEL